MDGSGASDAARRRNLLDRVPSWSFLLGLVGLLLLYWLITLTGPGNPVSKYIWDPIVGDEGYNTINTLFLLMPILGLVMGWVYRLLAELDERVDLELIVAVVPYLVWGSVYRVLEDADLFGPFNEQILAATGRTTDLGSSCIPAVGGSFLHQCFGLFYITPIIYVEVTMVAVALFWLGHQAKRVSLAQGPAAGLRFYGLVSVALLALYMALWAGPQTFIRYVANPLVALAALLVAFVIVWRDTTRRGHVNPRWVMFSYGIAFLLVGLYYVFGWMTGGHTGATSVETWKPPASDEMNWWVLAAVLVAPLLVSLSSAWKGRAFSGRLGSWVKNASISKTPGRSATLLIVLVIIDGLALFGSIEAFHLIEESLDAQTLFDDGARAAGLMARALIGPAFVVASTALVVQLARRAWGVHPALAFYAEPVNLIMIFGQACDGLMTSLGIDIFGYEEKHVLPKFLIEFVARQDLPAALEPYPTTLVMVPLKILIVLGVVWLIDVSSREEAEHRKNLIGLVKLAIIMVGLSPGVRDAVRLAMAV